MKVHSADGVVEYGNVSGRIVDGRLEATLDGQCADPSFIR